jgi:uncharacterized protein
LKVLLDTNVLVAAFLSRGACHELVEHCALNHEVVASEQILEELGRTLQRKARIPPPRIADALALLRARFTLAPSPPLGDSVIRDPDDDLVLSAAREGGCSCIVTGDAHLLELGSWSGIRILNPHDFWRYEAEGR